MFEVGQRVCRSRVELPVKWDRNPRVGQVIEGPRRGPNSLFGVVTGYRAGLVEVKHKCGHTAWWSENILIPVGTNLGADWVVGDTYLVMAGQWDHACEHEDTWRSRRHNVCQAKARSGRVVWYTLRGDASYVALEHGPIFRSLKALEDPWTVGLWTSLLRYHLWTCKRCDGAGAGAGGSLCLECGGTGLQHHVRSEVSTAVDYGSSDDRYLARRQLRRGA